MDKRKKWRVFNPKKQKNPLAYKSGDWDGLMSDLVKVKTKEGDFYLCSYYEGVLDSHKFHSFLTECGFDIENVIKWREI